MVKTRIEGRSRFIEPSIVRKSAASNRIARNRASIARPRIHPVDATIGVDCKCHRKSCIRDVAGSKSTGGGRIRVRDLALKIERTTIKVHTNCGWKSRLCVCDEIVHKTPLVGITRINSTWTAAICCPCYMITGCSCEENFVN
jgi:hypothetical protein